MTDSAAKSGTIRSYRRNLPVIPAMPIRYRPPCWLPSSPVSVTVTYAPRAALGDRNGSPSFALGAMEETQTSVLEVLD